LPVACGNVPGGRNLGVSDAERAVETGNEQHRDSQRSRHR
jgi:hypothetical protein